MRYSSLTQTILITFAILVGFVSPALAQNEWQLFPRPSFPHKVRAATIHDGELIVGGNFTSIHDVQANYVAKWNGVGWAALDDGTPEAVRALISVDGALYSGSALSFGDYAVGDGYVTRFDGTNWEHVGTLVNPDRSSPVEAMVEFGGLLVVGGNFDAVEGLSAAGVATYDGASWSSLANGPAGPGERVTALCTWQGNLIAGGDFTVAGGGAADRIARWTGTAWVPIGPGLPSTPEVLIEFDSDLWAGFSTGLEGAEVRRWDGLSWTEAGAGVADLTWNSGQYGTRYVLDFAVFDADLYISGAFSTPVTSKGFFAGRWNGSSWETFGNFVGYAYDFAPSWSVDVLVPWADRLVLGGIFPESAGLPIENIVAWNGADFERVADDELGLDGYAYDLAIAADGIVVAGGFDEAGALKTGPIARWDGVSWNALGATESDRIDGSVHSIELDGTDLLASGTIKMPDSTTARVARFDGTSWTALGDGSEPLAREIAWFDGDLVAVMEDQIRRWNGSSWEVLGTGMQSNVALYAFAVYQGQLFAGGAYDPTGYPKLKVFQLVGGQWTSIAPTGTYSSGRPWVMEVHDGMLLVGGDMDGVGELSSPGLIAWDGVDWSARTTSVDRAGVYAIGSTHDGALVIGGTFRDLDGPDIDGFAIEDPVNGWMAVEGSPTWGVYALLADAGDLWVGGSFKGTVDGWSGGVAIWNTRARVSIDQPADQPADPPVVPRRVAVDVVPNPFNPQTTFRFELREPGPVDVEVFDQGGRRVRTILAGEWLGAGEQSTQWDGRNDGGSAVASGVYLVRIRADGMYMRAKMTLVR